MDANEIIRLLLNLVRKGTITAVDHDRGLCRVTSGELQTNWIRWMALRAGTTREWNPPTTGEQVLLLSPGGDPADAVALTGIFSDQIKAPGDTPDTHTVTYPDDATIEYDHKQHALTATLPEGATVKLIAPLSVTVQTQTAVVQADSVTIDAQQTTCTGDLQVGGNVQAAGDILAANISLQDHKHQEQGDGATTSEPL